MQHQLLITYIEIMRGVLLGERRSRRVINPFISGEGFFLIMRY